MRKIAAQLLFLFFTSVLFAQGSPFDSVNIMLTEKIYFDFGKYDLRSESDSILRSVVDSVLRLENFNIHIEAHTDFVGTNDNNLKLSRRRAEITKTYLVENGLPADRITTSVFGEEKPIATNDSDDGRQQNRRAVITVFEKRKMTTIEGTIVDKKTGEGIQAKVIFHTKKFRDSLMTNEEGFFQKEVVENTILGVDIYKEGYFFDTQMLRAKDKNTVVMEIPLAPIAVGESVVIKNLYFVGNQAVLLKSSQPELPKVLKFMQLNKDIKIEIEGHINAPFRTKEQLSKWEWNLSTNRAKVVYDFLIGNDIAAERLTYKGYGNTQMVYPKARDEMRQAKNRRVEIKILDDGESVSENKKE